MDTEMNRGRDAGPVARAAYFSSDSVHRYCPLCDTRYSRRYSTPMTSRAACCIL
jgi:hypothetical protein